MKHIARRELLRGTGVAALAAGAAMLPIAAYAVTTAGGMPLKGVKDDPKLFDLAESVIIKIREVGKLNRLSSAKYRECTKGLPVGWAGCEKHKAKFDRRAITTGYTKAGKQWGDAGEALGRDVLEMSKQPAKSSGGVAVKALIITTIMKAWQCQCDDVWAHVENSDKLLVSLLDEALNVGLAESRRQ